MIIVNNVMMFIIMNVAKAYCGLWYFLRCRLFRRNLDLDYHVFTLDMPLNSGVPFFAKVVESNSMYEKTSAVKIGKVCIRYTIEKLVKLSDVAQLNSSEPVSSIKNTLIKYQDKIAHRNSSETLTLTSQETDEYGRKVNLKY